MLIKNSANISITAIKKLNIICKIIENNSKGLDTSGFKGIHIISDDLLPSDFDGRLDAKKILLPKNKIEKYFINGMDDIVKSTIYHELCHIDISNKLPKLHLLHSSSIKNDDYITAFTIMIIIEYLAHLKSYRFETNENRKRYLDSVNSKLWNFNLDTDKILFIKHSPYIIARDHNNHFISNLKNVDLKNRLLEIEKEIKKIISKGIKDDYSILLNLQEIVKKYINNY